MKGQATIGRVNNTAASTEPQELMPSLGFNRVFERRFLPKERVGGMMEALEEKLFLGVDDGERRFNLDWFKSLKSSSKPYERIIKRWDYTDGVGNTFPIGIKDTRGIGVKDESKPRRTVELAEREGLDYEAVRDSLAGHHKAVRAGIVDASMYRLHLPRPYGIVGERFLAMEWIPEVRASEFKDNLKKACLKDEGMRAVMDSFQSAYAQYEANMKKLMKEGFISHGHVMQIGQAMVAGHTNPRRLDEGKWVFYIPYDLR